MEAPEKIYLSDFTDTTEAVFYVKQDNTKKTDIEYIRTDAFIEKAEKYFIEKAEKYFIEKFEVEDYNDYIDVDGSPIFNYGRFVEDFKNYMKGGEE